MIVTNVLAFTNDLKNPLVDDALVRFEDGEITFVGPRREYSIQEDEEIVDGEKGILLPSFSMLITASIPAFLHTQSES